MSKNIQLLLISHSFLKKINTKVYTKFSKKFNIKTTLVSPEYILTKKKKVKPDFKKNFQNIELIYKKTIFEHLRIKIYLGLLKEFKKRNITHVILDLDLLSIQSLILLFFSFFYNFKILYYSNENNIILEKNIFTKLIKINLYKIMNICFIYKIHKILCYTKQIKNNMDVCGFKNKTEIIPLGFDTETFLRINNNKQDKFIISYFGRISESKGIHTLLKSLDQINIKNWTLYIDLYEIEDLRYYKLLKPYLKKLYKENKLKVIKPDHNNINHFMQITNLTIVPSEWNEQYGRVIQEAIACGSIVIGSNIGSIPELIRNNEFLFEPGNVSEIRNLIEKIYYNYSLYRQKFDDIEKYNNLNRSNEKQAERLFKSLS